MLTKSAKSKPWPGVLGNGLPPPGVVIMAEGKSSLLFLGGGVDGRSIRALCGFTAGDGEAARYSKRSAPLDPPLYHPPSSSKTGAALVACEVEKIERWRRTSAQAAGRHPPLPER